jgi:integrase
LIRVPAKRRAHGLTCRLWVYILYFEKRAMPRGERGSSRPFLRGRIWYIRYSVPGEGRERYESSGSADKKEAIRLLNKRRKEIDDRQVSTTDASVGDLLKLYLDDHRRNKRHSYKQAEGYVRLHLKPAFGDMKTGKVESKHIRAFIDQKQAADYANATINRFLEALLRGYTLGMKELPPLVYAAPPIADLMLEEDNVREGFLEHEEYLRMREELPDHQKLILVIGYHFGMRRGEILKLRWNQVDWDANLIRLEKRQTKAKQSRIAPRRKSRLCRLLAGKPGRCSTGTTSSTSAITTLLARNSHTIKMSRTKRFVQKFVQLRERQNRQVSLTMILFNNLIWLLR